MPLWLAPAHNELPAKITVTGAAEEGIARVINEPDVLPVAGGWHQDLTGWHRDAGQGYCVWAERWRLLMISLLPCVINTKGNVIFHNGF